MTEWVPVLEEMHRRLIAQDMTPRAWRMTGTIRRALSAELAAIGDSGGYYVLINTFMGIPVLGMEDAGAEVKLELEPVQLTGKRLEEFIAEFGGPAQ